MFEDIVNRRPNAHLRASDAERNEIVDALSKHFTDGRLDAAELEERIGKAVAAKTRGDLDVLVADLPMPSRTPPRPVPRPSAMGSRLLALVALFVTLAALSPGGAGPPHTARFLVLVIFLAVFLQLRRAGRSLAHRLSRGEEPGRRLPR